MTTQIHSAQNNGEKKRVYILDTNVLLHDPAAIFAFAEHDVFLPLIVLEELDNHKKGVDDLARNARQITRYLGEILPQGSMTAGFPLQEVSAEKATGRLYFVSAKNVKFGKNFAEGKADNIILSCAASCAEDGHNVILVTKDINLRVKALASDIPAQDYRNDRSFTDADLLPTGIYLADASLWDGQVDQAPVRKNNAQFMTVAKKLPINSFVLETTSVNRSRGWRVTGSENESSTLMLLNSSAAGAGGGIEPRNIEQAMALSLLLDREVDCVALLGKAGCGKTLLALAASLQQVQSGDYAGVILTRSTVPLGEDIGFLPGTEEEKMGAWMKALEDCYEVLNPTKEVKDKVKINSMAFMRGRSFQNKIIIIDEAQNLTPKQIRTLLTRASEGSKVILTGNLTQIDTPYLDEGSSGLAWAVKKLQDWKHAGHIILPKGERSRLATYVEDVAAPVADVQKG